MQVKSTTDYNRFKKVTGNRELNETKLKNIGNSILQHNLLEYNPIFVNSKLEVIDGQHRLEIAKRNGLTIYYTVVPNSGIKEIVALNTARANWTMEDYMRLWITKGKEDYVILRDFCEKFGVSVSIGLYLLMDKSPHEGGRKPKNAIDAFKHGDFQVGHLKAAITLAERLQELRPYLEQGVDKDRDFIQALRVAYRYADHKKMLHKIKLHSGKIQRRAKYKDYLRELEDTYNYHVRVGNEVWFR